MPKSVCHENEAYIMLALRSIVGTSISPSIPFDSSEAASDKWYVILPSCTGELAFYQDLTLKYS